jgi:hypothetical protein
MLKYELVKLSYASILFQLLLSIRMHVSLLLLFSSLTITEISLQMQSVCTNKSLVLFGRWTKC